MMLEAVLQLNGVQHMLLSITTRTRPLTYFRRYYAHMPITVWLFAP